MIKYDDDDRNLSDKAEDTMVGWGFILDLCKKKIHIGLGPLDSFLSGPDIERRVELVVAEVKINEWLRLELKDTLSMYPNRDLSEEQIKRLSELVN